MGSVSRIVTLLFLACIVDQIVSQTSDEELRQKIDAIYTAALECSGFPGGNVAVVRNGEVFHTNGYGVKNVATQVPLTSETLVNIASVTKHFVTTTMAKVFELNTGYNWDSTVRSILGDTFYLSDGYMSNKVTVKDLLCHRVGIGGHNVLRSSGISLEEMVRRLRHLTSGLEFRDGHLYNNLMYNLADQVIRVITGAPSWDDMVQANFFDQLQMNDTVFVQTGERWEDYATAYTMWGEELSLDINKADYDLSSAAGGIGTNAVDMAKWMLFHLSNGKAPDGTPLVDADLLQDTHRHCGIAGTAMLTYPDDDVTYSKGSLGLGWFEGFYRSYELVGHGGLKGGFHSIISLLPDVNIGIYASTTGMQYLDLDWITMYVADILLNETTWMDPETYCSKIKLARMEGREPLFSADGKHHGGDILAECKNKCEHMDNDISMQMLNAKDLTAFEGTFGHFGYGNLTVFINDSTTELNMAYGPTRRWSLSQTSNTTFTADGYGVFYTDEYEVVFEDDGEGDYSALTVDFASPTIRFIKHLDMASAPPPPELCG